MITEMTKLAAMLANANIPYQLVIQEYYKTPQIFIPNEEERIMDIICHKHSYGGNIGLLEIMGVTNEYDDDDDVVGWLTAKECYTLIRKEMH